jgi:hypothetical protein
MGSGRGGLPDLVITDGARRVRSTAPRVGASFVGEAHDVEDTLRAGRLGFRKPISNLRRGNRELMRSTTAPMEFSHRGRSEGPRQATHLKAKSAQLPLVLRGMMHPASSQTANLATLPASHVNVRRPLFICLHERQRQKIQGAERTNGRYIPNEPHG